MKQLPLIPDSEETEETPLPLIVAQRWNFPLAHIQTENGMVYAIQDWMRGLLGGDVRHILSQLCKVNPEFASLLKKRDYKATDNKVYQRPYIDEDGLILILVHSRLSRGRNRLSEVRNFIASLYPEYEHLKCREVQDRSLVESEFQSVLVETLSYFTSKSSMHQYYFTASARIIDILIKDFDNYDSYLLIECKVDKKDFYKAIGQLIAYQAELSETISSTCWVLAIAMPYEIIDNYIREIIAKLPIHLISILNETIIDAVTGEPFRNIIGRQAEETSRLMKKDLATGKPLLKNP